MQRRFFRNPQLHFKHQLRPLGGGFHVFRRELRLGGDKADLGREHCIHAIQLNPRLIAHFQAAYLRRRQENRHARIAEIQQAHHLAARADHIARLRDFVFHHAVFRAGDLHVAVGRLRQFKLRLPRRHARLRFRHLRLRLPHRRQGFRFRRLRRFHRRRRAIALRTATLRFRGRNQILALHLARVIQFHLRQFLLLQLRRNLGIRPCHRFLRLFHARLRPLHHLFRRQFARLRLFHATGCGV